MTANRIIVWRQSSLDGFTEEPAPAFVAGLAQRDGGDIGVHGSLTLARALLAAHLVDELRLAVAPSIALCGRRP